MRPRRSRIEITDAGLICFIKWARRNSEEVVLDPVMARQFLQGFAGVTSTTDPGVALAERIGSRRGSFDPGRELRP